MARFGSILLVITYLVCAGFTAWWERQGLPDEKSLFRPGFIHQLMFVAKDVEKNVMAETMAAETEQRENMIEIDDGVERNRKGVMRNLHESHPDQDAHLEHHAVLSTEYRIWTIIGLFGLIIILSIGFEECQHRLIHAVAHSGDKRYVKMIDAMFKELTILGFVGLCLMVIVKCGLLKQVAVEFFPHLKEHHDALAKRKAIHGKVAHEPVDHHAPALPAGHGRRLHEEMDPVAHELFELFEEVHMMIFYVMVAFITLCLLLLVQASITKKKFVLCENARLSDFLKGNVGNLNWKQKMIGGTRLLNDAIEYRLVRREFFHPWDDAQANIEARPASFDFSEYLGACMSDIVVSLVEIPSTSFAAIFLVLICCKPAFTLSHYGRERFMVFFAWGVALTLYAIMRYIKRIYYLMLPSYAGSIKNIEYAERELQGKTAKPQYMGHPYVRGKTLFCKRYWGTRAPNRQEALFPFWRNGPKLFVWIMQLALFLQGVYLAVYFTHIVKHEQSNLDMFAQFIPLMFSLFWVWPNLLFLFTITCNTGYMKHAETISEVARTVEAKQFKKYSSLIFELEVKALVHQIQCMDNYMETGRCVKNGDYERWYKAKLQEFELTMPTEQKAQVNEVFDVWDSDKSGSLDAWESQAMMQSQGKPKAEIDSIIRQWIRSRVFRPIHDEEGRLEKREGEGLSRDDFKVFMILNLEVSKGDFDEDRLETFLSSRLDASGDGLISVEEFMEALPLVVKAAELEEIDIKRMFKIIEASADESKEADEIAVSKVVIWLKKYAIQRRTSAGSSGPGVVVQQAKNRQTTPALKLDRKETTEAD